MLTEKHKKTIIDWWKKNKKTIKKEIDADSGDRPVFSKAVDLDGVQFVFRYNKQTKESFMRFSKEDFIKLPR